MSVWGECRTLDHYGRNGKSASSERSSDSFGLPHLLSRYHCGRLPQSLIPISGILLPQVNQNAALEGYAQSWRWLTHQRCSNLPLGYFMVVQQPLGIRGSQCSAWDWSLPLGCWEHLSLGTQQQHVINRNDTIPILTLSTFAWRQSYHYPSYATTNNSLEILNLAIK